MLRRLVHNAAWFVAMRTRPPILDDLVATTTEEYEQRVFDEWMSNAITGEFAKRNMARQFPEKGDPDVYVPANVDFLEHVLDVDQFERQTLAEIYGLPSTEEQR